MKGRISFRTAVALHIFALLAPGLATAREYGADVLRNSPEIDAAQSLEKRVPDIARTATVPGDVDDDGILSLADASLIRGYLLEDVSLTSEALAAADANQDGSVTLADAVFVTSRLWPVVPAANLVSLDDQPGLAVNSAVLPEIRLTWSSAGAPPLQTGDVVLATTPTAFLRKVVSVQVQGVEVILDTTESSLAEAFESGSFSATVAFGQESQALGFGSGEKNRAPSLYAGADWDLSGRILFSDSGLEVGVNEGRILFDPKASLDLSVKSLSLPYMRFEIQGPLITDVDMAVTVTLPGTWATTVTLPGTEQRAKFAVGKLAGEMTMALVARIEVTATSATELQGGCHSSTDLSYVITNRGGIWGDDLARSYTATGDFVEVHLDQGQANVRVTIAPQVRFSPYRHPCILLSLDPYLSVRGSARSSPPPPNCLQVLASGCDMVCEVDASILSGRGVLTFGPRAVWGPVKLLSGSCLQPGVLGTITIDVTPDTGRWRLIGPSGFSQISGTGDRVGSSAITWAFAGNYTLHSYDNVPAHSPPPPETRSLAAGGAIAFTPTYESLETTITLPGDVPLVTVRIPDGGFLMGSDNLQYSLPSEMPVHWVDFPTDFHLGKFEITQRQWLALMGDWPTTAPDASFGLGDNRPAYFLTWNDAQDFVTALNAHVTATGQGPATFRLPSEAEWEYACRDGGPPTYFAQPYDLDCTNLFLDNLAWFCGNSSTPGVKDVGQKSPNRFGLYDMYGNVLEFCQDWFYGGYVGAPTDGSAWEQPAGIYRIVRGGNWTSFPFLCNSTFRYGLTPAEGFPTTGFRVARGSVQPQAGTITIDVTPDTGSWVLVGPPEFTPLDGIGDRLGGSAIQNAPVGPYTLSCLDVLPGFDAPVTQTATLLAGETIAFTPTYIAREQTILLPGDVPLAIVRVRGGTFLMGSEGDTGWDTNVAGWEAPVHQVTIGYDFDVGRYEITQQQWLALMGTWPGTAPNATYGVGDSHPAYYVSWTDAQNFIAALNSHVASTGQGPATFRLPSESEWEYACRAGSPERFTFGPSGLGPTECGAGEPGDLGDFAWFCGTYLPYGTKPVGQKQANAFGLHDMHGNVYEWCQDWLHYSYVGAPADGSAWETDPVGVERVARGGAWAMSPYQCRSSWRYNAYQEGRSYYLGFRVVRNP